MGMRRRGGACGAVVSLSLVCISPAWAEDPAVVDRPAEPVLDVAAVDRLHASIETEEDPELRALMEEQMKLFEAGQLNANELGLSAERGDVVLGAPAPADGIVPMPVVDWGGGSPPPAGGRTEESLPPGAREELEALFRQGTGDPNSETDRALREQAGEILEKYGIDPREMGPGPDGDREHFFQGSEALERISPEALEHMAPEAREQMERMMQEHEGMERPEMYREMDQHFEAPTHEYETPVHEYETPVHEYEAPTYEGAPTHEYEAPQQEYEAPQQDYQPPQQDYQPPQQEYQPPA